MKKIFRGHNYIALLTYSTLLSFIAFSIYVTTVFMEEIIFIWRTVGVNSVPIPYYLGATAILLFLSLSIYLLIIIFSLKIECKEKSLFVSKQIGSKRTIFQFKLEVNYLNIAEISLYSSTKNSKNQKVSTILYPITYILITMEDGTKNSIGMLYYSEKQMKKLIDEIVYRAKFLGNDISHISGKTLVNDFVKKDREVEKEFVRGFFSKKKKRKKKRK